MSEAMSPGRRSALELGRKAGTIREDRQVVAPDGLSGTRGASSMAKVERPLLEGASVTPTTSQTLPFKRS
jgi:hypothetical protein